MPKHAIRTATSLALVAMLSIIAVSLLITGARDATAFNTAERAVPPAPAAPAPPTPPTPPAAPAPPAIPAQYTTQCSNGTAVPNPADNAGLVADCAALLASKSTLRGTSNDRLTNWSADRAISDWYGVTIANNRVSKLELRSTRLQQHLEEFLVGAIPPELGNLASLTHLDLGRNALKGEIPAELGNLSNLTHLDLGPNVGLTGPIPAELGNLSNLTHLDISFSTLKGEIPAELGNLSKLEYLSLDWASPLKGEIPAELGNLVNLTHLDLGLNHLTGEIPAELGNLVNLTHLDLGRNHMTGEIPAELGNLVNLTHLYLEGYINYGHTGAIPAELGNLVNLTHLDLYENNLSGAIPSELGNLSKLERLNLYSNHLTGCVPQSLRAAASAYAREQRSGYTLPFCAAAAPATPTPTATTASCATATPSPTPTATPPIVIEPTPTATTVLDAPATPTPTATPAASGEVMDKLNELETQVADTPNLSRLVAEIADLVAALLARIAELEGGDTGAATATPTPSPTPTATPTSVVAATDAPCTERLAGSASVSGAWADGCVSANPPSAEDYYARFYTFTLDAAAQATITLSSADAAPYLYLLNGAGTGGAINRQDGAATTSSAAITAILQPGSYTIEATTYYSETTGDFTLELELAR